MGDHDIKSNNNNYITKKFSPHYSLHIKAKDISNLKKKNLFIVGAGRSGTTFLWRILNNCPEVHLCTEIHYFSSLYHNGFLKNFRKIHKKLNHLLSLDLYRCLTEMDHFGMYWQKNPYFSKEEIYRFFESKQITEKNIYEFLFEHDLKLSGKPREQIKIYR
jgi:hypothetical protein